MPQVKHTPEEKKQKVLAYLQIRFPEGTVDRFGNLKYDRNGKHYRLKPKTRVVRHEVCVDMGDRHEWVLIRSYSSKSLYERSQEI